MKWPEDFVGKIIQGDCLKVMRGMPDGCVDAVITDPPYSEKTHAGARTRSQDIKLVTFESITPKFMVDLAKELCRVSSRWVVMTCDFRHCAEIAKRCSDIFIRAGVWIKPNGAPQFTGDRPATGWEAVAILHRPGRKRWNGGGSHAVWNVPKIAGEHPTQKPMALITKWVNLFSDEDELIFDPFRGSGTTLLAAIRGGRRFCGIEIAPKYCAVSQERIAAEAAQGKLL